MRVSGRNPVQGLRRPSAGVLVRALDAAPRVPSPQAIGPAGTIRWPPHPQHRLPVPEAEAVPAEDGGVATMPGYGLRALRKSLGVSPRHIAETLGVTARTLYGWERGGSRLPVRLIPSLARCLDLAADELVRVLGAARHGGYRVAESSGDLAGLRAAAGFSRNRAARLLGVSEDVLARWERGEVVPPWRSVELMASLYESSPGAVAEASGAGTPASLSPAAWSPGDLPDVLRSLRRWYGLTQAQVAECCAAGTDSVRGWERGRHQPRTEARRRLEALYRLPPDSLSSAYAR